MPLKEQIIKFFKSLSFEKVKNTVLVIYFLLLLSAVYHSLYARKIIPGVKVGVVRVGGKTYSEALKLLEDYEKDVDKELKLSYEGKDFWIRADDIGLTYDWDSSVSRAFEVGRTGHVLRDSKEKIVGLLKTLYIGAFYDYDDEALGVKFSIIKGEINKEAFQSGVMLDGDTLTVTTADKGLKVEDNGLYSIVIKSFDRLDFSNKLIPTRVVNPIILEEDISALLPDVKKIIDRQMVVTYGSDRWVLEREDLLELLAFEREGRVKMTLNEAKFDAFMEEISNEVNQLPKGQVTKTDGDRVINFEITKQGREVDVAKFINDFRNAYFGLKETLELPVNVVEGLADKEKYGIYALLGEGTSHFAGSAQSRIHNLTLAADRTNGVLVAPGATYSLNNSVGDISSATGFQTAYIIKGDRTVLGAGGGVCQTSTTLFRAILFSGLPVVMRHPHAYRVSYYEQDMGMGFDAAVFQPSWDLKFKNDTAGYVLVQTSYDLNEQSLTFKLYGTPDGRSVYIPDPVVLSQSPPPETLYQDDPTLPKGTVKQIDFAAWGASVILTRTVRRDGEVLFEDVFKSNFQPWRAIYLVGTKE